MASTPKSAKAKGRRLQDYVKQEVAAVVQRLGLPYAVRSTVMGEAGDDVQVLGAGSEVFWPYGVECKNVERLNIWDALEQARKRGKIPLVAFKRNRSEVYATLPLSEFLRLVEAANQNGQGTN